ncbi:MAG TPA: methyltransferase domain-containing protein [Stellaceae bacterium]|jgi:phosphatidylethanolamine/phosphatidyl-N-methylethanolamine N-methyltransferase|nr:methyltransferase domain-containing protein [Stellaceae bacterium]
MMIGDAALFFGLWLRKPLQIAAVCPSGAPVAATMARLADPSRPGPVLELGAGTGSITRGLLEAGWLPERIIAYEREPQLVDVLRRELAGINAVIGDVLDLERQLSRLGVEQLAAVVSSLPIKWFPLEAQRSVLQPCFDRLGEGGCFYQLTNAFSSPLPIGPLGIAGREVARVWRNVPPAQIWAYQPLNR